MGTRQSTLAQPARRSPINTNEPQRTAKVVHVSGKLREYAAGTAAGAVEAANPGHYLCSGDLMRVGQCVPRAPESEEIQAGQSWMALTNFLLTVAGVTAAVVLLRYDVKQSASVFRRNVRQIRHWLEEESSAAAKSAERTAPKELDAQVPKKDVPKEEKH